MNSQQAKKIDIVDYLKKINIPVTKNVGDDYWFISPFRDEKTSSFKVNQSKNVWYDFGLGAGGNILDLVMKMNNCNFTDSLNILSKIEPQQKSEPTKKRDFSFHQQIKVKTKEIEHPALLDYLEMRGIELQLAKSYCKECHFVADGKNNFAIGFKTDSNSYEIRNLYAKMNILGKDITTIKNGYTNIAVFEGFFDFLSYIQLNYNVVNSDFLILNSTSMVHSALKILKEYNSIHLYLDNDSTGAITTKLIIQEYSFAIDHSKIYEDYKDLNEYLLLKRETNFPLLDTSE